MACFRRTLSGQSIMSDSLITCNSTKAQAAVLSVTPLIATTFGKWPVILDMATFKWDVESDQVLGQVVPETRVVDYW